MKNTKKHLKFIAIGATSVAVLAGVIYGLNKSSEKDVEETNAYNYELSIHPKIIDYGMVDGCHVKHVTTATKIGSEKNEYNYTTASFYTADCNGTDTTTETKVNGKYMTTTTTIKKPKMN